MSKKETILFIVAFAAALGGLGIRYTITVIETDDAYFFHLAPKP